MIVGIIQARISSSRLPEKVMKPILGLPMIARQIERVRRARRLDRILVATSEHASDDVLADWCRRNGVDCFRGALDDVLDRFYRAACSVRADIVVRLTGDCPLSDPALIDEVIQSFESNGADYASNTLPPTYPDGLDIEVMRMETLTQAWREAVLPSQREHVTPFIHTQPQRFRLFNVHRVGTDLSALRWTVDGADDYDFVCAVYQALYPTNAEFSTDDVLALLQRQPALQQLNADHRRNEGYERSLRQDTEHRQKN